MSFRVSVSQTGAILYTVGIAMPTITKKNMKNTKNHVKIETTGVYSPHTDCVLYVKVWAKSHRPKKHFLDAFDPIKEKGVV